MYVVTGGAGFIGSNLLAVMEERGLGPLAAVDRCDDAHKTRNLAKRKLTHVIAPEQTFAFLDFQAKNIKAVLHLGAITSTTERDVAKLDEVNVRLSRALWAWCTRHQVPFIYASSAATYGSGDDGFDDDNGLSALAKLKPLNPYGQSKHSFDLIVTQDMAGGADTPPVWAGFKFFNVYGANELHKGSQASLVPQVYPKAVAGQPYPLFRSHNPRYADGEQLRDFIYVDDCCDVMLWFLENGRSNAIYNLGTGKARTFLDLAGAVYRAAGRAPSIVFRDTPPDIRSQYQYFTEARMDRLRAAGYGKPFTTLEQGVAATVQKYLAQPDPYR